MNWSEYKVLSEKTLSTQFHCEKQDELLLHAIVGVLTELEELTDWNGDEVNKKEEVADSFWYVAILDRVLDLNLEIPKVTTTKVQITNEKLIIDLYKISSKLLDFLKKKLYYNKPIDLSIFSVLSKDLFNTLCLFCEINNIKTESILDTNIAKLKARYGDKFSSDRAINRDLTTERSILEK
jgi:NTP pyrophosphatase (non-canonical NTP hydrolase)